MERNNHCRTALTWQPEGKRRRARPRTTWRRTVEHERKEMGIASWEMARNMAMDRTGWRKRILIGPRREKRKERKKEKERETERERQRKRDRERQRERERQRQRERDRERVSESVCERERVSV